MDKERYSTYLRSDDITAGEACQATCPLHIDMPNYYNLMDEGKYDEAYKLLKSANPFPAITGRVCFFPCEYSCVRGKLDTPVAIREIEYFLSDYIQLGENKKEELFTFKEGSKIGSKAESVAIIGSGPAGMVVAWELLHLGYKVTIYEKESVCGGMAHLGIPVFKILRDVIDFEIEVLKKLGAKIVNNVEIGKDISINKLKENGYKAICLALGATVGRKLNIAGEKDSENIYESTEFLKLIREGSREKLGDNVLVIGGGNTAMDTSRTSLRLGTKKVTVVCREDKDNMPAYDYEINDATREGVEFAYLASPKEIITSNGKLKGVNFATIDPKTFDGTSNDTIFIEGADFFISADCVILSISQTPNLTLLGDKCDDVTTKRGLLKEDLEYGINNVPGIFAAGDVISGPRSIVSAMASGKRAAIGIDKYINNTGKIQPETTVVSSLTAGVKRNFDDLKRQKAIKKEPLNVNEDFDLLSDKFTKEQVTDECNRCMRCNNNIEINQEECILCNYCVDACPVGCLTMITDDNRAITHQTDLKDGETGTAVMIRDAYCIRCGLCIDACPPEIISFKKFDIK